MRWCCLLLVFAPGCGADEGSARVDVVGTLTNAGRPIVNAEIIFQSADTPYSVWTISDEQGAFSSPRLPPGKYLVAVRPGVRRLGPDETPPTEAQGEPTPPANPLIPPRFHDAQASGLSIEVSPGQPASFDFDLSK